MPCTVHTLAKGQSNKWLRCLMAGRGWPSASCLWTEIVSPSRTSSWCRCQQPPPGPLPQCWKLIFPAQHLVSNTSSPLNLKQENQTSHHSCFWEQQIRISGSKGVHEGWKEKSPWLKLLYYPISTSSVITGGHNQCCTIWEGNDHCWILCLFYFSSTNPRTMYIDLLKPAHHL